MALKGVQLPQLLHSERSSSRFPHNNDNNKGSHSGNRIYPSKSTKTREEEAFRYLSSRPAAFKYEIFQKPREKKKLHGSFIKPCFLEKLECHLRKELEALDNDAPKFQDLRLQVFQEVFSFLIEEFRTYKPILSAIKNQYDITLAHLHEQIRDLLPLRAKLVLVSEQCDRKILEIRLQERDEIVALKKECQHLIHVIQSMDGQQSALQIQIDQLKEDLATQYQLYREERDARKFLIARMNAMQSAHDSEQDKAYEEDESMEPDLVKMALRVCKEDLTKVQVELNRIQAEYNEVVPRRTWENLNQIHEETLRKLETLQTDFNQMKMEYDTLLEVQSKPAHVGLHSNQSLPQHASDNKYTDTTSISNGEECPDGGNEHLKSQSSQRKLVILLQGINSKNEFLGLGINSDVPLFLRYEGKMTNLKLEKTDVIRVIKDIWMKKTVENEKNDGIRDLQTFLHSYLEEQYNDKAGVWAYSLIDSIQSNLKDDFICLFYDILTGKVDESIYHGQTQLVSHLFKVLIHHDTKQSGSLTISELDAALKKAFPMKSDQDIEELLTVAQTEQKSNRENIEYQNLYAEDPDGQCSEFLIRVKKQASVEKHRYISELKAQLDGKGEVNPDELSTAFKAIDASLDAETLNWNLSLAFQTKDWEVQALAVDTEVVLQRLSVANVKRGEPIDEK